MRINHEETKGTKKKSEKTFVLFVSSWLILREEKMKKFAVVSVLIAVVFLSAWRFAPHAQSAEEAAARVPLENYLKGHATGDGNYMRKAFHTEAKVFSFRDGKFNQLTSAEFAARFTGAPAPDEAQRKRWIESVKITGNAGVGVIVLDYPTVKFTDYMSLLKVDGEWKIVHKTFSAEPKAKP